MAQLCRAFIQQLNFDNARIKVFAGLFAKYFTTFPLSMLDDMGDAIGAQAALDRIFQLPSDL